MNKDDPSPTRPTHTDTSSEERLRRTMSLSLTGKRGPARKLKWQERKGEEKTAGDGSSGRRYNVYGSPIACDSDGHSASSATSMCASRASRPAIDKEYRPSHCPHDEGGLAAASTTTSAHITRSDSCTPSSSRTASSSRTPPPQDLGSHCESGAGFLQPRQPAPRRQAHPPVEDDPVRMAVESAKPYMRGHKIASSEESRFTRWILTFNAETETLMDIRDAIAERWSELARYVIVALETNGTGGLHMHAFIWLHHRMASSKLIQEWPFLQGVNFACCGTQQSDKIINYVKKQGEWEEWGNRPYVGNPNPDKPKKMSRNEKITSIIRRLSTGELSRAEAMLEDTTLWMERGEEMLRMANLLRLERDRKNFSSPPLRPWQADVEKLIVEQGDREILFVVDTVGNRGKTWFCSYMRTKYGALILTESETRSASYLWQMEQMVLFDIPRSAVPSYATMEQIKNGFIISEKYKVQTKTQPDMKVAVFMNQEPASGHLSFDRIRVYDLDRQSEVKLVSKKQRSIQESLATGSRKRKSPCPARLERQESVESTSTTASVRKAFESRCRMTFEDQEPLAGIDQNTSADKATATVLLNEIVRRAGAKGLENAQFILLKYLEHCYEEGEVVNMEIIDPPLESPRRSEQRGDAVVDKESGKVLLVTTPDKSFQVVKPGNTIPSKDIANCIVVDDDDDLVLLGDVGTPTKISTGLTQELVDAAKDADLEWPEDSQECT